MGKGIFILGVLILLVAASIRLVPLTLGFLDSAWKKIRRIWKEEIVYYNEQICTECKYKLFCNEERN